MERRRYDYRSSVNKDIIAGYRDAFVKKLSFNRIAFDRLARRSFDFKELAEGLFGN